MPDKIYKDCIKKLDELKITNKKPYIERLEEEIKFIKLLDRSEYIRSLIAKIESGEMEKKQHNRNGLVYAYLLGISEVDPIVHDIPHIKKLSDPPDVDVDLSNKAKSIMEDLLRKRHGDDKVLHIYTTNNYSPKSTIRDLCRLLSLTNDQSIVKALTEPFGAEAGDGMDFESQIENFNKNIKGTLDKKVKDFLKDKPKYTKLLPKSDQKLTNEQIIFKYAKRLSGQVSHTGKHAAGVVVSSENFADFAPMKKVKGEILLALQEGGHAKEVSTFGCLKYDWLAIVNLDKHVALYEMVEKYYGEDIYEELIYKNNFDDEKTIEVFNNAETLGVFQFSNKDMRGALKKAHITSFKDVAIMNAMFRPGPLKNLEKMQTYMHHPETITYENDIIEPIVKDTYSIIVYQEQVMQAMQYVGKLTPAEADKSRSILKKLSRNKNPDTSSPEYFEYKMMLDKFKAGAQQNGLTPENAEQIVHDLSGHLGYSFNKAHAVSYSINAYIDAYFKAHYPLVFYKVLCDFESDKNLFSELIQDAKIRGIKVESFDINKTEYDFSIDIEANELRIGFNMIKGGRKNDYETITRIRKEEGEFKNFDEFLKCLDKHEFKPNIGSIKPLIELGAFDHISHLNRNEMLHLYELFLIYCKKKQNKTEKGRWLWKDIYEKFEELGDVEDFSLGEKIDKEFQYLEMYLLGDPLTIAEEWYERNGVETVRVSQHDPYAESENVIGVISNYEVKKTRTNKSYLNIDFTDMVETINVKVWQDNMHPKLQKKGAIVMMRLEYQKNFNSFSMKKPGGGSAAFHVWDV